MSRGPDAGDGAGRWPVPVLFHAAAQVRPPEVDTAGMENVEGNGLVAALRGDGESARVALGAVFDAHAQEVYRFCRRRCAGPEAAEDLMSVVFLQAWATRGRAVQVDGSARAWLYAIAVNVVRNERRSVRRHRAALARYHSGELDPVPDPAGRAGEQLDADRAAAAALAGLGRLRGRDRDVAELVLWQDLDVASTACALGVSTSAVESALLRARRRLRDAVRGPGGPAGEGASRVPLPRTGDFPPAQGASGHEQGERSSSAPIGRQ